MVTKLLFARLVERMFHQNTVKLTVKINLVSNELETSLYSVQESLLYDELLDVVDVAAQILNALTEPHLSPVGSFTGYLRNQYFQLVIEFLGRRLEFGFNHS